MAHHKSAVRQHRRGLRRAAVNKMNKSALRTEIKNVRKAIQDKNVEEAKSLLPQSFAAIDKSVKKKAIHKNKGKRLRSRLSRQVENIGPAPSKA